jgi:hypothetical protein
MAVSERQWRVSPSPRAIDDFRKVVAGSISRFASRAFCKAYEKFPQQAPIRADKKYALLKENPQHRSMRLKKVGLLICFWT